MKRFATEACKSDAENTTNADAPGALFETAGWASTARPSRLSNHAPFPCGLHAATVAAPRTRTAPRRRPR
eukprot:11168264-Lingulodinium_polyedra.AAC.1